MGRRLSIGLNFALATALIWALSGILPVEGASTQYANFVAPSFTSVEYSVHNSAGSSACSSFAPSDQAGENQGDLDNGNGSYLANVRLPQGATVTRLSLFINDNDTENAHLYLVRKRIAVNLAPRFAGYRVMANTRSDGAVDNVMRRFSDTSIVGAVIDNSRYMYFLELIECGITEPFAGQVVYRT